MKPEPPPGSRVERTMSLCRPVVFLVCAVLSLGAQALPSASTLQVPLTQPPATTAEAWKGIDQLLAQWQTLRQSHPGVSLTNVSSRARAGENPSPSVRTLIADAEAAGFFTLFSEVAAFGLQADSGVPPASDPVALRYLIQAATARAWIAIFDHDLPRAASATADLFGLGTLMLLQSDDITILMAGASEEFAHVLAHEVFTRAQNAADLVPLRHALASCEARAEPRAITLRLAAARARHAYALGETDPLPAQASEMLDALGSLALLAPWQRSTSLAQDVFDQQRSALLNSPDTADRAFAAEVRTVARSLGILERACGVRRGLILLGALRSHFLSTGSYPDSLADLVPDQLAELPADLYADGPFLYSRSPDGHSMALWGVGLDGIDNQRACPKGLMTGLRTQDTGHDCVFWSAP